ncbi:hypothetical protein K525DRAFT_225238 [Schizophyllum commune Loenen D]|nr:hypothetical protein K525DRAFT_225238 [Schizophyllum commune Loenen D]
MTSTEQTIAQASTSMATATAHKTSPPGTTPSSPHPPHSSVPSPHHDLRHVTSIPSMPTGAGSRRTSRLVSSGSIPSSPTSIHSAESNIFERDIEAPVTLHPPAHHHQSSHSSPASSPPGVASPSCPQHNPHLIPRAHNTLEHSVPSVLDSAATVLTELSPREVEEISVVTPSVHAPSPQSRGASPRMSMLGIGSPPGTVRSGYTSPAAATSRSPSPALGREGLMLNIPQQPPLIREDSGITRSSPTTSAYLSTASSPSVSPRSTHADLEGDAAHQGHIREETVTTRDRGATIRGGEKPRQASTSTTASAASAASHTINKRLSFISYSDLLASTPASTLPLSALTSNLTSADVEGLEAQGASPGGSPLLGGSASWGAGSTSGSLGAGSAAGSRAASLRGNRDSTYLPSLELSLNGIAAAAAASPSPEWEREGLGRGLEERLLA